MNKRHHKSLVLEITHACNYNCRHCYRWTDGCKEYSDRPLTIRQTLDLLENVVRDTGVSLISLSGGEPLLSPHIFEIIDFLNDRNIAVNLITNGSLLDDRAIARLASDKVSAYEIPLLSGSAQIHDILSGVDGAFDRATLAIAKLKAARQTVITVFVATKINLPELEATFNLAIALDVDGIMFNRFNPGGTGFNNIDQLQASPDELHKALGIADRISGEIGLPISCSIPLPPCLIDTSRYANLNFGYCALGMADAYFTIDPHGNLRPCNHSPTILGNLVRHSFWELVDSERMIQYLAGVPEMCKACIHVSECKGCCRAAAESCFGSPKSPDPFVWEYGLAHGGVRQLR